MFRSRSRTSFSATDVPSQNAGAKEQDPAYASLERLSQSRQVSVPRSPSGQVL